MLIRAPQGSCKPAPVLPGGGVQEPRGWVPYSPGCPDNTGIHTDCHITKDYHRSPGYHLLTEVPDQCSTGHVYLSKHKRFVWQLYNVGPTSKTLGQHYTNVIRMFCVYWDTARHFIHFGFLACWYNVADGEPTLKQHWVNVLCLLDSYISSLPIEIIAVEA